MPTSKQALSWHIKVQDPYPTASGESGQILQMRPLWSVGIAAFPSTADKDLGKFSQAQNCLGQFLKKMGVD